jgi:Response regulator containing a CheY-like receiver domain and an HTH DNA-binding domain
MGEVPAARAKSDEAELELNVFVIDDHQIVGIGLQHALADYLSAVLTCVSSVSDIPQPVCRPAVAVLDLRLDDGSTPATNLKALMEMDIPTVVYTSADDPYLVRQAIKAGALSIVRKSSEPKALADAIKAAICGETLAEVTWSAALDTDEDFVSTYLTPVEAEFLSLYASGATAEYIARTLGFSKHTVNTYVSRIRKRYRENGRPGESRIDLFRRAAEDGLVSLYDQDA